MPNSPGDVHGSIPGCIVHKYHFVDILVGQVIECHSKRLLRIICGHNDDELLVLDHECLESGTTSYDGIHPGRLTLNHA